MERAVRPNEGQFRIYAIPIEHEGRGARGRRRLRKEGRAGQSDFARLAGGTMPFIRRYSTICP
jgi:hypothetical protein